MSDEDAAKSALAEEMGMLEGQDVVRGWYVPSSFEELRELLAPVDRE